jgi:Zn-dependent protease/predicted transcriptional regulator
MQATRSGVRLAKVFGVSIHFDYSWLIFFFLVVWTFGRFYFPQLLGPLAPATRWGLAIAAALLLVLSVIIHEMSHAVTSNHLGFPVKRITLFIFGGVAHLHAEPDNARTEFLVAGAGPLSSIVLWLVFWFAGMLAGLSDRMLLATLFASVGTLNLVLALFNLVPGFPLDGGRLLRAVIWWRTKNLRRATNIAARGGEWFAYLLMAVGVLSIFADAPGGWISGVWYILIGVFVKNAAEQSYRHVLMEELLDGIRVAELMGHNPLSVWADEHLDVLEQQFLQHKFTVYPVLDEGGRVIGIVDVRDVREVPREAREGKSVREVMQPVETASLPGPHSQALEVLGQMLRLNAQRLPVVDREGRLAGIVTRADIMNMFEIRSDLVEEGVV